MKWRKRIGRCRKLIVFVPLSKILHIHITPEKTKQLCRRIVRRRYRINTLHKALKKRKIQLNAAKTEAVVFTFNKSPKRKTTKPLIFIGKEIKFTKSAAAKCLKSFYPLLAKVSKLSHLNKNIVYKSMIRPITT